MQDRQQGTYDIVDEQKLRVARRLRQPHVLRDHVDELAQAAIVKVERRERGAQAHCDRDVGVRVAKLWLSLQQGLSATFDEALGARPIKESRTL